MAVKKDFTTWVDSTAQDVHDGRTRITAVEIDKHVLQGATVYLQLFDGIASGVTPGVNAPHMVIPIDAMTRNANRKIKVIVPGGGFICTTGLTVFVATTSTGGTAVTTTAIPDHVAIFHTPGN
jgi:hypothetical protein